MPAFYNENLDDDKIPDGQLTFQGGMFSNAKPRRIQPEQCALLSDAVIEVTGEWSSRRGTDYLGGAVGAGSAIRGLGYFKAASLSADFEVAASDTHIYWNNGGNWTQLGSQAFSGAGPVSIIQGGQGQGASIGDDKFYVAYGGDIFRWNGSAWLNISSPETSSSAPRQVSYVTWHTGRLVAWGPTIKTRNADPIVPDAIYLSDILDPTTWGTSGYDTQLRIGGGDGSPVVSVVSWKDFSLAVFKRHSSWVVNADPSLAISDMQIQKVSDTVGCIAKRSACQVGNDVLFLTDDGVRSIQQVIASDQQHELTEPLSFPIDDYIRRINWTYADQACAVFWRGLYILAAPLDSSTVNNYIFVFNSVTGVWAGIWNNLPVSVFALSRSTAPKLVMGLNSSSRVLEYLDFVNEQDATDLTYTDWNGLFVTPSVITREFAFSDEMAYKHGAEYEIEWNKSSGSATIIPILDDKAQTPNTMDMSSGGFAFPFSIPLSFPAIGTQRKQFDLMHLPVFRGMQLQVLTTGPGKKQMRQVVATAFPESSGPLLGD